MKHLSWSRWLVALLAVGVFGGAHAGSFYESYTFTTLAGLPEAGPGSRDGSNDVARFNSPSGVAVDGAGNVYVSDSANDTMRKILPAGWVATVAGLAGSAGSADGTGAGARFNEPQKVAADRAGNLFVADTSNQILRKITPAGVVTTFAGVAGITGTNDGPGTEARFNNPQAVAVDGTGNIYVADYGNHTIRKVTPGGVVTTLAGTPGVAGTNNGTGTAARFNYPFGLAVSTNGTVYVADTYNHVIRQITSAGVVTTFAGKMSTPGNANGTSTAARFYYPVGVAIGSGGTLYVADYSNSLIRKVTSKGVVSTLAGSAGSSGNANGTGAAARFSRPYDVAVDLKSGAVYVADLGNQLIRKITSAGVVTTLAGRAVSSGSANGTGGVARFNFPSGTAVDGSGNVYVSDYANQLVRKIARTGAVTTLAGVAGVTGTNNGTGTAARFKGPAGVAVDGSGNVYVADYQNHGIRRITPARVVTTLAGRLGTGGTNNGAGTAARLNNPIGVAVDASGSVYVADSGNHAIRKITPAGVVTTLAGLAGTSGTSDGVGTAARFNYPQGVAVDGSNYVYVADAGNGCVRKVAPDGTVTTLAGLAGNAGSDDGTNSTARFNGPLGIAVDSAGNLYVGDTGNQGIRKVTPEGVVTTLGGLAGVSGSTDGSGSDARFDSPEGVAVDSNGFVYVADANNHTIREGNPALSDRPVVDDPIEAIGILRHLDVTNLTTTSWSWSMDRYPAAGTAQLSATNVRNPTFNPDAAGDYYVIRFQGWDSQGRTAIGTVSVGDDMPPQVTIASPAWDQQFTNADCTITGTAADDIEVTNVQIQLNDGPWLPASGLTNWTNQVTLIEGANMIRAYAMDNQGHFSVTNSVSVFHGAPLSVQVSGLGTVTPDYSGKLLAEGQTYSVTAHPGIGAVFTNWTGSLTTNSPILTFVMQTDLAFTANFLDVSNPVVAITAPVASQRVSNTVYTVKGTARDNAQVASVWCQLNGDAWIQAAGTTSWSTNLTLPAGTNTVRAYALDSSGRGSATNSVTFLCVPHDRLTVQIIGKGTLSPNYSNALLQLGRSLTITATPASGSVFSNWTGTITAITPKLTFTMQTGMVLQATFMTNPFPALKGSYAGLFTNELPTTNAGAFTATLTDKGSLSGKLLLSSTNYSLAGSLSGGGLYSNSIARKGRSPLVVNLELDMVGKELITGQVSDEVETNWLRAYRSVYSTTNRAPAGGKKYTLAIAGGEDAATQPAGYGFGTVSVDVGGTISFNGTLADGTKVSQTTFLSRDGHWPLYVWPVLWQRRAAGLADFYQRGRQ